MQTPGPPLRAQPLSVLTMATLCVSPPRCHPSRTSSPIHNANLSSGLLAPTTQVLWQIPCYR